MKDVLNAKNQDKPNHYQLMTVGGIGTGKTTLFRSLPGKKFMYVFDPNGLAALDNSDIDYIEFIPDVTEVSIAARTLKASTDATRHDKSSKEVEPMAYPEFEADLLERVSTGYFEKYDWIGVDSASTLQDIIMDRVLWLAGRPGKHPEEADWTSQMNTFRNVCRVLSPLANLYMTAHTEVQKDELTGKIHGRILMTGKNRLRVPTLFANIIATSCEDGKFWVKTKPDSKDPVVRVSPRLRLALGDSTVVDVTMDLHKALEGQGLGRYVK